MKKRGWRGKAGRLLGWMLAATMTVSLAACGGKAGKNDEANQAAAKENVYRMEDIAIDMSPEDGGMGNATSTACVGRTIYMIRCENYWDEYIGISVSLTGMDIDSGKANTVKLFEEMQKNPDWNPDIFSQDGPYDVDIEPVEPYDVDMPATLPADDAAIPEGEPGESEGGKIYNQAYMDGAWISSEGVYLVLYRYSYSVDEAGMYTDLGNSRDLHVYDLEGREQLSMSFGNDMDDYFYFRGVSVDKSGNIVLVGEQETRVFDKTGKLLQKVPMEMNNGYVNSIFTDRNGNAAMVVETWDDGHTSMKLHLWDSDRKSFDDGTELPATIARYNISAGLTYDLLCRDGMGVYGYNIGDESVTPLVSYINSDIDSNTINTVMELDDEHMVALYHEEDNWSEQKLVLLTHVAPEDVPDKEVLLLACNYLNWDVRRHIIQFNKESDKYRITVKDYSDYNTEDDYMAGRTKLNSDIVSGNLPDIMVLSADMPVNSYISKGLLADIGKMIEDDPDINWDDYMTNVFEAYSVNGKLYSVIPGFYIQTVIGKQADLGDRQGWTMEDLKAYMAKHPDASAFGETMTRSDILWYTLMYSGNTYIDRNTGKCNFDTREFQDTLEFIKQFPTEYDWNNDSYWQEYETQYRNGKTLLMATSLSDFYSYQYSTQGYFGEPTTLIGFPSEEGNGAVVAATDEFCILAKSAHKDGAWEFLRYYLMDEYQSSGRGYGLPVLRSALLAKMEEAQQRPYWEDETGHREYYDNYFWIGGEEIVLNPLTKEECDMLYEYISSVTLSYFYDEGLRNIISEETEPFFAGQKSVEEVTEIIQNRARVYINESR